MNLTCLINKLHTTVVTLREV